MSFYSNNGFGTPPFIGGPPVLPPVGGYGPSVLNPGSGPTVPVPQTVMPDSPYVQGPYCFGIDVAICANLPEKLILVPAKGIGTMNFIPEVSIPAREICKSATNLTCAIVVIVFLVIILGVALQGLLNNA